MVNYNLNEDGSFMDFNTFNLIYGVRAHFQKFNGLLTSVKEWVKKKNNNILVKTCSPYFTDNFLYLLNATKSRKTV